METNPIINPSTMTAININVEEFMNVLANIRSDGVAMINLDIIPDEGHPGMNRLIIHPIIDKADDSPVEDSAQMNKRNLLIRDPDVSRDNDDILNLLNQIV